MYGQNIDGKNLPLLANCEDCQWAFTCLKWTIETLEQGVNYVQSYNKDTKFAAPCKLRGLPVGIYMLKVHNRNTRTRCELCSKLQ